MTTYIHDGCIEFARVLYITVYNRGGSEEEVREMADIYRSKLVVETVREAKASMTTAQKETLVGLLEAGDNDKLEVFATQEFPEAIMEVQSRVMQEFSQEVERDLEKYSAEMEQKSAPPVKKRGLLSRLMGR